MKRIILLMVLVSLLVSCKSHVADENPWAEKGVLDLRGWNFEKDGSVYPKGEWEFYWEKLYYPDDFKEESKPEMTGYLITPGSWTNFILDGKPLPKSGYATYRLKILIDPQENPLAVRWWLPPMAYELYINGNLILKTGRIAKTLDSTKFNYMHDYQPFFADTNELELVILISEFITQKEKGITDNRNFFIGAYSVEKKLNYFEYAKSYFALALLFMFGIYHLIIFFFRKKDKSLLYFALVCFYFTNLNIFLTSSYRIFEFDLDAVQIYFPYFVMLPTRLFPWILHLYVWSLFPKDYSKNILKIYIGLSLINVIITFWDIYDNFFIGQSGYLILSILSFFYLCIVTVLALIRRREGSILFLAAMIFLFITNLQGILAHWGIILLFEGYWTHVGFLLFVLGQSFILSKRYSNAFKTVEKQSKELEHHRHHLEEMVEERTEELSTRSRELEIAMADLKSTQSQLIQSEKMAALGQLIAGVAHEVNTPLGVIRSSVGSISSFLKDTLLKLPDFFSSMTEEERKQFFILLEDALNSQNSLSAKEERQLKRELLHELEEMGIQNSGIASRFVKMGLYNKFEKHKYIFHSRKSDEIIETAYELTSVYSSSENIAVAAERASKVVFALKSFAHFDKTGEAVEADISEGIETVLTLYHNMLKQGIEVEKDYKAKPVIKCFPDELNQVWTNLIHNSIQAMDGKGKLKISIEEKDENVIVSISDNGRGIPDEIKGRIFEPFFTTKPQGEGSGLGLDIVRKIIEKHKGKIEFDSEQGRTEFRIFLPK